MTCWYNRTRSPTIAFSPVTTPVPCSTTKLAPIEGRFFPWTVLSGGPPGAFLARPVLAHGGRAQAVEETRRERALGPAPEVSIGRRTAQR